MKQSHYALNPPHPSTEFILSKVEGLGTGEGECLRVGAINEIASQNNLFWENARNDVSKLVLVLETGNCNYE